MKKTYIKKIVISLLIGLSVFILIQFKNNTEENILTTQPELNDGTKTDEFVALRVLDKEYRTSFIEGDSVYKTMEKIRDNEKNNFSFISKEYSGLGIFIDEINGVAGESGKYWIYYVNEKEAGVSVSKYLLKSGDIITWKQE